MYVLMFLYELTDSLDPVDIVLSIDMRPKVAAASWIRFKIDTYFRQGVLQSRDPGIEPHSIPGFRD